MVGSEGLLDFLTQEEKAELEHCNLCPRHCGVNRLKGEKGFCNMDLSLSVALVLNHKGEEPILSKDKGVCNLFFSHCNCQCIFCQNYQISRNNTTPKNNYQTMDEVISAIKATLQNSENTLGFVSPTHQLPVMKAIIRELHKNHLYPTIIYNTGGYDNVKEIQALEGIVDVYLPDFKYSDDSIAKKYSSSPNYTLSALSAIKEMYYQKGSTIRENQKGNIESGLIVRHLVIPNEVNNSINALKIIAEEISPNITLSLMSQYRPPFEMKYNNLNRLLSMEEYKQVTDMAYSLGFHNGYFQDLSSVESVVPDFDNNRFLNNK